MIQNSMDENLIKQIEYLSKQFPKFSRRHWIISNRFDFIYDFIKKIEQSNELTTTQKEFIKKKLVACRFKLCSLEYHDRNIAVIEKKYKKTLTNMLKHPSFDKPTTFATITPEVAFEFEAFLLQCKALLDIYSQAIGYFFHEKPSNIKKLKNVLLVKKNQFALDLLELLKSKWLEEFATSESLKKTKRDIIAHYSMIDLSNINIQKLGPKRFNTIRTKVDDKLVIDYTRDIISKARTLIHNTIFVGEKNKKI